MLMNYVFLFLVGIDHKELVDLAKQHFGNVPYEYKDDAVPILSHCRFTGSEVGTYLLCILGG